MNALASGNSVSPFANPMAKGDLRRAAIVFLVLLAVYAGFAQSRDWNTATRMLLTYALAQDWSVEVTRYVTQNGAFLEHPPTRDIAKTEDGRYYCDKAPGLSFHGLVPYAAILKLGWVKPYPASLPARERWPAEYPVTVLSSGVATAATGALLYLFSRWLGASAVWAAAAAFSYGLATPALPYATLYYGHAVAGWWTLAAIALAWRWPRSVVASTLAGLAAGIAVTIDYPQIVAPAALIVVDLASRLFKRPAKLKFWAFIAGGVPPAILLMLYHYLVTGSPFRFPYTLEMLDELFGYHKEGYGIPIRLPDPTVAMELLFGRKRGLLWFAAPLAAAPIGAILLARRGQGWLVAVTVGIFGGLFFINAGYPTWDGGWATGPRFLLAGLPLLAVMVAGWLSTIKESGPGIKTTHVLAWAWVAISLASFAAMLVYTTGGGRAPSVVSDPWREILLPAVTSPGDRWSLGESLLGMRPADRHDWGIAALCSHGLLIASVVAAAIWLICRRQRARPTTSQDR